MSPYDRLLERAERVAEGVDANQAMWDARMQSQKRHGRSLGYEMVVEESTPWSVFLADVLPKMTEHFRAKGLKMTGAPWVQLSIWRNGQVHLLDCGSFFEAVREIEGLDEPSLIERLRALRADVGLEPASDDDPSRACEEKSAVAVPVLPATTRGSDDD